MTTNSDPNTPQVLLSPERHMIAYYAWDLPEGGTLHFSESPKPPEIGANLLYVVKAESWEEAMAIHHLRQGFEPYVPGGKPATCSCGAVYYPEGSGQCWKCKKDHG